MNSEGTAGAIYVLKAAPLGLTASAIKSVLSWQFKPAQKDGSPVAFAFRSKLRSACFEKCPRSPRHHFSKETLKPQANRRHFDSRKAPAVASHEARITGILSRKDFTDD